MKKFITVPAALVLLFLLICSVSLAAAIDANTNLAANKSAYGTFTNSSVVTDIKNKTLSATSGDITDTPQYLTVDLGLNLYLDRIRITWDKDAYSSAYTVRTSSDSKTWVEEATNLDASTGVSDPVNGNLTQSISLTRTLNSSRFVQIMVPASSAISNIKGPYVKVIKIEAFPSLNQKFAFTDVGVYGVSDTAGIVTYKTSIGSASGSVSYGTDPNKLSGTALNTQSGVNNSIMIAGLKPKLTYFYQVKATDFYGKSITSTVNSFTTVSSDLALHKKVTGTFSNLPDDKLVKQGDADNVLSRVTDGDTGYFTGMATSGPVSAEDQYVVIDLGQAYKLGNIISYWRALAYPQSLSIQLSADNATWTTVADGVDVGAGAFGRSDAGDPMQIDNSSVPGSMSPARYIKLIVKKGSPFFHKHADWTYVQLMEVQAFASK